MMTAMTLFLIMALPILWLGSLLIWGNAAKREGWDEGYRAGYRDREAGHLFRPDAAWDRR
jgi:hypothetical protein